MRILLTNDDGFQAEGILALREALLPLGEVNVVAPENQQSGTGHCMTVHNPLRIRPIQYARPSGYDYAISGYPTDCVKIAIENLLPQRPDLVVSGINHGPNLGTDILYSGTASAALEGLINGIPSIAVSLVATRHADFSFAASFTADFCLRWQKANFKPHTMFNINVPSGKNGPIRGFRYTDQGIRLYTNTFEERMDPRGEKYFWLSGEPKEMTNGLNSDIMAIRNNYVSVTPIQFDLTDYSLLNKLLAKKL